VQRLGGENFVSYDLLLEKRRNKTSVNLIKHEAAVKMNYTKTCKNFYTFLQKKKIFSKQYSHTESVFFKSNNKPNLIT